MSLNRAVMWSAGWLALMQTGQSDAATSPYTVQQASRGEIAYEQNCARCHGLKLTGTEFGPGLVGESFIQHWAGESLAKLFSLIRTTMPPGQAGTLADSTHADIIAYILNSYGVRPGTTDLPSQARALEEMSLPGRETLESFVAAGTNALSPNVSLPKWATRPNPLDRILRVTENDLDNPPAESWLSWRRTRDAGGYSPLDQITKSNVRRLRVAWTLALHPGPNQTTPLAHGGVVFVSSYEDHLQAIDAATGDELWHYQWHLPRDAMRMMRRNIALYGDNVYFTTSDAHVVALRTKTGSLVWQQSISDPTRRIASASGGPLIASGVVMQGVNGAYAPGGGYIVGMDADTGKILWRFNTVAQPGEANGNSWNGLPLEQRMGGSVWTAGSYDSRRGLALFGPAPTYATEPLRAPVRQPGVTSDALYTDSTIALNPKTGALAWHYQHLPNDQWDLDWAFERHVVDVSIKGERRRLIVTAGKQAIYDALDADNGTYVLSLDLGLQNLVTSIDASTGTKTVNRQLVPGDTPITVCPHLSGAKSWLPASYDPEYRVLYVPLAEACMDILPSRKGWYDGVRLRPRPGSDGKYGRLQAINLESRQTVWMSRQRAPQTTGVLATAGGLIFAGALDRHFTAYDAATGEALWSTRLSDAPNGAPITYFVDGVQYVAVVVGSGFGRSETFLPLIPEIHRPLGRSSTLWVFRLSD